jgi:hypothetical protein
MDGGDLSAREANEDIFAALIAEHPGKVAQAQTGDALPDEAVEQ